MAGKKGRSGRNSLKETAQKPLEGKKTGYSLEYKKVVMDYWRTGQGSESATVVEKFWPGLNKHSTQFKSKLKLISEWKKKEETINDLASSNSTKNLKKIRPKSVALVLPTELEDNLAVWIRSMRNEGIPVPRLMLKLKAQTFAEEADISGFKCSDT